MKLKFIPIILFVASAHLYGQVDTPPLNNQNTTTEESQRGTYYLKDIVVEGSKKYSASQIMRYAGLLKNEAIEIPGIKIANAIKKLWETDNFSEVEIYVDDIDGDKITLRLHLQDLKDLGEVKVTGKGMGKSKQEKVIKDNNLKPGVKITNNLIASVQHKVSQEYINKGFADTKVQITDQQNTENPDMLDWTINVEKGKKVKRCAISLRGQDLRS